MAKWKSSPRSIVNGLAELFDESCFSHKDASNFFAELSKAATSEAETYRRMLEEDEINRNRAPGSELPGAAGGQA